MLKSCKCGEVKLNDGIFADRAKINREYLMELDNNCLLQNHYLEAGFVLPGLQAVYEPSEANLHWGWESPNCQLRGHFLGHWMSAAAKLVADTGDSELAGKLTYIVKELAKCQKENGGQWVGSIPEKYFDRLANGQYIWSPQYTMHKTLMGLLDTYRYTGNELALEIISNQADWYVTWTDKMLKKDPWTILRGEASGMLELWAALYEITHDDRYKLLADRYSQPGMFQDLLDGKDPLTNCHANASIPLAQGAAKMYEVTGDDRWLEIVKLFWKCAVTDRGTFPTGGQNSGEFWTPHMMEGQFIGDRNQEFCTIYNMVRVADYLYRFTGEKEYGDFIEKCLYNGFLAQQNKLTGMPTYFLPMSAGARKKWGSKRNDFWCCHGSMVQSQTVYTSLIYYTDDSNNTIYINQYIPSTFEENGIRIVSSSAMKYYNDAALFDEGDNSQMSRWFLEFTADSDKEHTLAFRVPAWIRSVPELVINGKNIDADEYISDGYIRITGTFKDEKIKIYFPESVTTEYLPDVPEKFAYLEGPIVLAGITSKDTVETQHPEDILIKHMEHTYEEFPWLQSCYRVRGQAENFELRPLYDITDEEYTIYFNRR